MDYPTWQFPPPPGERIRPRLLESPTSGLGKRFRLEVPPGAAFTVEIYCLSTDQVRATLTALVEININLFHLLYTAKKI
jgi:hypothetical protein